MVISITSRLDIKNDLKITPALTFINNKNFAESMSFDLYKQLDNNSLLIPYYYNKSLSNVIISNKKSKLNNSFTSNIILRKGDQTDCYNCIIDKCNNVDFYSGIINLTTASGKTVLSLKLIETLKLKTLIIVNTQQLLNQWYDKIKQFCNNVNIGFIQGKTIDIDDKDIVIGMVQTLSNDKITLNTLKSFGITIMDEVHSIPTKVFSNIFFKITSQFQFGLTATIDRKDRLDIVFKYFLGDIIYSNINDSNLKQQTIIDVYNVNFDIGKIKTIKIAGETKINMSYTLNQLSLCEERNNFIISILQKLMSDPNRKILCMSDRINNLEFIHSNLKDNSGLFIGKMKSHQLESAKTQQILLATYPMVIQGFDYPDINTLVFCTPRSNIEQAIGRIYRKHHNITPLIIDIVDNNTYIYINQYKKRQQIYKTKIENPIINKLSN